MGKVLIELPFVSKQVSDVLLWRNLKASALAASAVGATAIYILFLARPIVHSLSVLAFVAGASPIVAVLSALTNIKLPLKAEWLDRAITEQDIQRFASSALVPLNNVMGMLSTLLKGQRIGFNLLVSAAASIAALILGTIPLNVLLFVVAVLAFTVPPAYEHKKVEVDAAVRSVIQRFTDLYHKVQTEIISKIPKAKTT